MEFSLQTEEIICQMAQHLQDFSIGNAPSDYECGMLFQYVFDKTTEAIYKMIMDEEIDTQFIPKEIYEGYAELWDELKRRGAVIKNNKLMIVTYRELE